MREVIDRSIAAVRLKADAKNRAPISLVELVRDLAFAAEIDAQVRGRRFTAGLVPADVTLDADLYLLTTALTNLLQNAFKFTRPQGHVHLRVAASAERVRFEIEDQCGGLPAGRVDDLFQVFAQNDSDRSGLGLGLAISKQAVEAHGGTIAVRDLPGQGCIFTVDLPRAAQSSTQLASAGSQLGGTAM
jgi:signal transduction histidine kinase